MYFIAVVLKGVLGEKITGLKEFMAENYSSRRALNSPPHITLVPPFNLEVALEQELINSIRELIVGMDEFEITLNGFGAFSPKVIFVKPEANESLTRLARKLSISLADKYNTVKRDERPFHPHITIGFRDLTAPNFHKAWKELQDMPIKGCLLCSSVCLLKHNGKTWDIQKEIMFSVPS